MMRKSSSWKVQVILSEPATVFNVLIFQWYCVCHADGGEGALSYVMS